MNDDRTHPAGHVVGLGFGLLAYALWGVLPVYFKSIEVIPASEIVAHRVIWSVPFLALLISLAGSWNKVRAALSNGPIVAMLGLTAILVASNWLLYVDSVTNGHILAASFGYYLNPLANVLLGRFILKERLSRPQWAAVVIAGAGISVLAAGALGQLWISLALCASFALYGLFRKMIAVDPMTGLAIETALLLPMAALWLWWMHSQGSPIMGRTHDVTILLLLAGIVSTTPLLLFTAASKRLRYSTLGMLQFLTPTLQFVMAVGLYGEPFTTAQAIAFPTIWAALLVFVTALARSPRVPNPKE